MVRPSRPVWSDAMIATALALRAEGHSASEIGAVMKLSRNAVLGQLWRHDNPQAPRPKLTPTQIFDRSKGGSTPVGVWWAWGLEADDLRRAVWARARLGAVRTRRANQREAIQP